MPIEPMVLLTARPTFDWIQFGDAWLYHLQAAFSRAVPTAGWGSEQRSYPGGGGFHFEVDLTPNGASSRLYVRASSISGMLVELRSDGDEIPAFEIAAWLDAVRTASELVDAPRPSVSWEAIIGPASAQAAGPTKRLTIGGVVGPLELEPTGGFLEEDLPSRHFSHSHRVWSWPVRVRGQVKALNDEEMRFEAMGQLRRLDGLLGVAWDAAFLPRVDPAPTSWGPRTISKSPERNVAKTDVLLPSWGSDAWWLLERDLDLANAVDAFYEGLLLHADHPSFALIGFVAATEACGRLLAKRASLAQPGNAESVRFALGQTRGEQEARQLTALVYGRRSSTAHAGKIHGHETRYGVPDMRTFQTLAGGPSAFSGAVVFRFRHAARELLEAILSGSLGGEE